MADDGDAFYARGTRPRAGVSPFTAGTGSHWLTDEDRARGFALLPSGDPRSRAINAVRQVIAESIGFGGSGPVMTRSWLMWTEHAADAALHAAAADEVANSGPMVPPGHPAWDEWRKVHPLDQP